MSALQKSSSLRTDTRATSSGYGNLAKRVIAASIKCEGEWVEDRAVKGGIVRFRQAALAGW
jgi:hypothetical protein